MNVRERKVEMTEEKAEENSDVQVRIAAARERKEKAIKHQESTRNQLEEQLATAELEAADEEAIAKACDELGERGKHFGTVFSPLGVIILRKPNALKYKQFQDAGKYTTTALESLIYAARFYPEASRLEAIFQEYPGKIGEAADCVADLAKGARKAAEGKS